MDAAVDTIYLSTLDYNCGYHQIPCSHRAKEALAFSPGFGFAQYTWNVMPQGVKPAANCFQHSMEKTFEGLGSCILPPFYDDITIKGKTFKDQLHNSRLVLQRVKDYGYTLNALKCMFFQTRIKYLGHIIEKGKISLDPERINIIVNFPIPKTIKSLRRFLRMAQFCSQFISDFICSLSPLYDLTRKDVPFIWTLECQNAFDYVKNQLSVHRIHQIHLFWRWMLLTGALGAA